MGIRRVTRTLTFTTGTGCLTDPERDKAREISHARLCSHFGGCSMTTGTGSWIDPRGKLLSEPIDVYSVHSFEVGHTETFWKQCASDMAEVYRQDCIAVTRHTNTEFELIGVQNNGSQIAA